MSDGNFNRALLPHTPYHSGLAVGRMQMRTRAKEVLESLLIERFPDILPQERAEIISLIETMTRL